MSCMTTRICDWKSLFGVEARVSGRSKGGLYAQSF